jgi:hypothetical protein
MGVDSDQDKSDLKRFGGFPPLTKPGMIALRNTCAQLRNHGTETQTMVPNGSSQELNSSIKSPIMKLSCKYQSRYKNIAQTSRRKSP